MCRTQSQAEQKWTIFEYKKYILEIYAYVSYVTSQLIIQSPVTSCPSHPDIQIVWYPVWGMHRWCLHAQLASPNPLPYTWCIWAAYTTTEPPGVTGFTMVSLEVAAEVVVPANVFSETIVHAAVSPEVAAHAAEPFEAAVLAAAPCVVMAPYNTLSVRHVTVEGTVDEHCTCSVMNSS